MSIIRLLSCAALIGSTFITVVALNIDRTTGKAQHALADNAAKNGTIWTQLLLSAGYEMSASAPTTNTSTKTERNEDRNHDSKCNEHQQSR